MKIFVQVINSIHTASGKIYQCGFNLDNYLENKDVNKRIETIKYDDETGCMIIKLHGGQIRVVQDWISYDGIEDIKNA